MAKNTIDLDEQNLEYLRYLEDYEGNPECPWKAVEYGEWDECGRYQYATTIIQHKETGKYYSWSVQRSGSHFTDWNYEHDDYITEVVKREEIAVVVHWDPAK